MTPAQAKASVNRNHSDTVLVSTELPRVRLHARGKVRDLYAFNDTLLIVATDRISAFDCVLPTAIPGKGKVLTQLSVFWFEFLGDLTKSHFLTADPTRFPEEVQESRAELEGRSMLVRRAEPFPVECVVRGYLAGSAWKEYRENGSVCGIRLSAGLTESEKLPKPIFTPATKATTGHDVNISFDEMTRIVGGTAAEELRARSLKIYSKAARYAETRGILIADTKFELGRLGNEILLIDEVLTPDSSRFWPSDGYAPGRAQPSFDKQFVRDYLERIGWDKQPPAPELPADVVAATSSNYLEAYRRLTGGELAV